MLKFKETPRLLPAKGQSCVAIGLMLVLSFICFSENQIAAQMAPPGGVGAPPAPPLPHISNFIIRKNGLAFGQDKRTHFYSRGNIIGGSAVATGESPYSQSMRYRLKIEIASGPPNGTVLISNESTIVVAGSTTFTLPVILPNLLLPPAPGPIPNSLHCTAYLYAEEPVGPNPHPFLWESKSLFLKWNGQ